MASGFYAAALTAFAEGRIAWRSSGGDTIKVILVDTADYTVDLANHEFLTSVPSAARVAIATMTTLAPTGGVLDAADSTFITPSGDTSEALIIYQHTGTDATSRLILYLDAATAGLPVTPNGTSNIGITWPGGATKIASL